MKRLHYILCILLLVPLQACFVDDDLDKTNTPVTNFDALWDIIDQHYCFFAFKNIDWNEVKTEYRPRVSNKMNSREFFDLCDEMLNTLQDGHVNLSASFATSYYRNWYEDYPVNYDERIILQNYFHFDYYQSGGITYQKLRDNIGYMHYGSFSNSIGANSLDYILSYFATCDGLIIDIRNNGGGNLSNVEVLVSRFISDRILGGYIYHKTGAGHNDFSQPYPYYYEPAKGRILYGKPVVVLTNRHTFSAANNFVQVMKSLPQVTIIGDRTGGGSGLPFSYNLPNGWNIRLSSSPILDAQGNHTEFGIDPTPEYKVDMDTLAALQGHDTILDRAIELLSKNK